jgi:hypothetical protein
MAKRGRPPDYLMYGERCRRVDVRQAWAELKFWGRAENAKSFRARHAGDPDASSKAVLAGEPRTLEEFLDKEPGSRAAKQAKLKRIRCLIALKNKRL